MNDSCIHEVDEFFREGVPGKTVLPVGIILNYGRARNAWPAVKREIKLVRKEMSILHSSISILNATISNLQQRPLPARVYARSRLHSLIRRLIVVK